MKPPQRKKGGDRRRKTASQTVASVALDLLEGLPFATLILNPNLTVQAINREAIRLLGSRYRSRHGSSFPALWAKLTQSSESLISAQLNSTFRTNRPISATQQLFVSSKTTTTPIEWTCLPNELDGTRVLVISIRDLSHEMELKQDRDRLAAIAEESPSPLIELDRASSLLYANPAMIALLSRFGYSLEGFPNVAPSRLPSIVEHCLKTGQTLQHEEVLLPEASFSWTFCPVPHHGVVRGYATDMTNIHKTQQALRLSADQLRQSNQRLDKALDEAKESARVKTAFLATVSHELRTPMNGVIGMTSLLMETSLTTEQQSYAETIRQCGEALLQLINDVLECSKIEAGKLELECLDFNLRTTVEQVLAQFAERAETKSLELTGLVHAAVPTGLKGDPGRLRQILTNLVANAVKFTDKGEVTLQAYLEEDLSDSAVIRFEVTDSGIGISPNTQAKLFRPFMQADSSTTRKYGGTGLGLSISKQLVELMGGSIGVRSSEGQGSTFWCTARLLKQAGSPRAILPMGDLAGKRVLIVDDNESNRLILHHLVSGWGMVDDLAEDAESALRRISEATQRGTPYDLAILDVIMPGKDGLQLARELQHHPEGSGIRLVVMTSMLQRGHAEQARQAGVTGYLPKPVRHDELRDCLRTVLGLAESPRPKEAQTLSVVPQLVTRHTVAENVRHRRVLVVEDNLVNQKLAVRMVEKLGYQPDVVDNGQEALTALKKSDYAAILMDCQMPIMDGFETTKNIRQREALAASGGPQAEAGPQLGIESSSLPHMPIIAVTANAMQGDRERCLAAGMDDYLSKPIKLDELRAALARWITSPPTNAMPEQQQPVYTTTASTRGIFDPARMYQNIGSDNDLFAQLICLFLDRHQTMLAEIRTALADADSSAVERTAHTFKGTAGNLCASEVGLTASRLEAVGRLNALHDAPPVYAQLELEVARLIRVLESYRQGYQPITEAAA
ncbi:MAG: putative Hybrid histidine kinase [Candidatus Nitrospira kreftii]|uniref:histidine kinase n=1 Tax=Candidatus Nitrospira kreftii TaxID=2652173 RepID=A0A7S8FFH5_9BACT|nr:MAG: putative Hybrid histidine kinase [Candidatus Nitrospira kreftii]